MTIFTSAGQHGMANPAGMGISSPGLGFGLSLAALVFWSISPFCFAGTGRRIGPFATNLFRLGLGTFVLIGITAIRNRLVGGFAYPGGLTWFWLSTSGVVGLVVGDFFLYRALATIGPGKTSQIQILAPAATAAIAWALLRETMTFPQLAGMALILAGVSIATWDSARRTDIRNKTGAGGASITSRIQKPAGYLLTGAWAAVWSALFQGLQTVLAREAFLSQPDLDPFLATTIRVGCAGVVAWTVARAWGPWGPALAGARQPKVLRLLLLGTACGPVAGMICYVGALKFAPAGVVTTITFMNPLIVIPLGAWYYGTRIGGPAIAGTAVSLAGVLLLGFG